MTGNVRGMLHPPIEPHDHGMLDVGAGNAVYWEVCGNPAGVPALVLHGGPGSGCTPGWRRWFDPAAYRIVLFDQRNCGRSTPHASEPDTDLAANTTPNLLADIERLREHLGIESWLVMGASWGSVLALAYARRFPERVSAMVLFAVATGRQVEVDLMTRALAPLFPDAWARFSAGAGGATTDLPAAYHRLLRSPSREVRERAAADWCAWEDAIVPTAEPSPRYRDPRFRMAFARIVTHYWSNNHFLDRDGVLPTTPLRIPGVIVQGRLDLGNLAGTPWLLHQAWPTSELTFIDETGHDSSTPDMTKTLLAATAHFARELS